MSRNALVAEERAVEFGLVFRPTGIAAKLFHLGVFPLRRKGNLGDSQAELMSEGES